MPISWLNHIPHAIAVYASWPALPSAHATLATGRPATALPGPVLHRLDCTSFCWRLRKHRLGEMPDPKTSMEFGKQCRELRCSPSMGSVVDRLPQIKLLSTVLRPPHRIWR